MTTPVLTTPVGRIRFAVGDHDATEPLLPGGAAQYAALLTLCANNEVVAFRAAAGALAAYYASQPTKLGGAGKSLDYRDRVVTWRAQAEGALSYPFGADGSASPVGAPTLAPISAGRDAWEALR